MCHRKAAAHLGLQHNGALHRALQARQARIADPGVCCGMQGFLTNWCHTCTAVPGIICSGSWLRSPFTLPGCRDRPSAWSFQWRAENVHVANSSHANNELINRVGTYHRPKQRSMLHEEAMPHQPRGAMMWNRGRSTSWDVTSSAWFPVLRASASRSLGVSGHDS